MLISTLLGEAQGAADEFFKTSRIETLLRRYSTSTSEVIPKISECLSDWKGPSSANDLLEQLQRAQKVGLFGLISSGTFDQSKLALERLSGEEALHFIGKALVFTEPDPQACIETRLVAWSTLNMQQVVAVSEALTFLEKVLPALDRAAVTETTNLGGGDLEAMITGLRADLEAITGESDV